MPVSIRWMGRTLARAGESPMPSSSMPLTAHPVSRLEGQREEEEREITMVVFQVKERTVPRILMTERLAQEGLDLLRRELPEALVDQRVGLAPAQLRVVLGGYTVLIVDSDTRVTDDLLAGAPRLQLIGRAGSDVGNIDLEAADRRGVLVVHAPGGDVPALAEHSMALLLALARHIVPAHSSLKVGRWEQSRFVGVELSNKTLSILGLGKVGREVARLAQAFSMRVLGYDPGVSVGQAQRAGVRMLSKAEVLQQADFVLLRAPHLVGSSETSLLIGTRELRLLKPGAYLVNCADGRLIDEAALLVALDQGCLAGTIPSRGGSSPTSA